MFRKISIQTLLVSFLFLWNIHAQMSSPLDIPLKLSGTFGELRPNHFHAGLDFRTEGVTGKTVRAAADGYIARIGVSPTGYGNVLYVAHPDGYMSVYGHLSRFRDDIAEYITGIQYEKKSFAVDVRVDSTLFPVKRGDMIALSGNSGGSGGPHLHFELRELESDNPVNALEHGIRITDRIRPVIRSLKVYSFQSDNLPKTEAKVTSLTAVKSSEGKYRLGQTGAIHTGPVTGISIYATDSSEGSTPRNGPYSYLLKIDNIPVFYQRMSTISYEHTLASNSVADYAQILRNRNYNCLWIEPNNPLDIYPNALHDGLIRLKDSLSHKVSITVSDFNGNSSTIEFLLKKTESGNIIHDLSNVLYQQDRIYWGSKFTLRGDDYLVELPKGSVYQDMVFTHSVSHLKGLKHAVHTFGNEDIPLDHSARIRIEYPDLTEAERDNLVLARVSRTGRLSYIGGEWVNGGIEATVSNWGSYTLSRDTVPPVISNPVTGRNGSFQCRIRDDFSGIASYSGEIGGEWVLMGFDAKTATLSFDRSNMRISKSNSAKDLKITVIDRAGNRTIRSFRVLR